MTPHNFYRRINSSTAKGTCRVHLHNFRPGKRERMRIGEDDVTAAIMASWELARIGFWLAGVRRLKRAKPCFARNSAVQEECGAVRRFDVAELTLAGCRRAFRRGRCRFEIAHQL